MRRRRYGRRSVIKKPSCASEWEWSVSDYGVLRDPVNFVDLFRLEPALRPN